MSRTQWLFLAGCLVLGGCAVAPRSEEPASATKVDTAAAKEAAEALPAADLNAGLLYGLLVADVAAQRGDLGLSAQAYLQTAGETGDPRLAKRATQVAVYAEQYDVAAKAAAMWATLAPKSAEAQQSLAALLLRQGRVSEAVEHMQALIAMAPEGKAHGFAVVTNILARDSDHLRSLRIMDTLVSRYPDEPEALYAYANLAFLLQQDALALHQVDNLLQLEPKAVRGLVLKAGILQRSGQPDAALQAYARAVELEPKAANIRLGYARMLVETEHLEQAREQFHIIGEQLPDNADVAYAEGLLALQAEDLDGADRQFRRLLKLGQRNGDAAYALGQVAERRHRPKQAIEWYRQVSDGNNRSDAMVRAALLIRDTEGLAAARTYLQSAAPNSDDEAVRLFLVEAEMLRDAGDYAAANDLFDTALTEYPNDIELLYGRAMNAERLGRLDMLEADLRAILKQDPNNVQALNALGYTLADRTNRYREAEDYIRRAYEQRSDDPAIIDSMGWVAYRLGRLDEAAKYLREALDKHYDPEIAAHLGEVLWQQGKHDEARQVWQGAHEKSPDNDLLNKVIQRFDR